VTSRQPSDILAFIREMIRVFAEGQVIPEELPDTENASTLPAVPLDN
jgi:hypothetical protein